MVYEGYGAIWCRSKFIEPSTDNINHGTVANAEVIFLKASGSLATSKACGKFYV